MGDYTKPKYQDLWVGACFYIHVVLIIAVAIYFWAVALPEAIPDDVTPSPTSVDDVENDEDTSGIWIALTVALFSGALFGMLWLQCIRKFAEQIIKIMLVVMIVCWLGVALLGLVIGSLYLTVVGVLFAAFSALYAWCVRDRIPFASACLSIASSIAQAYTGTIWLSLATVVLNFIWIIIWIFAFWAYVLSVETTSLIPTFLLLVSLYWGVNVWRNVSHTTTCGVAATWNFNAGEISNPSRGAYKRTMTTSFGSVCMGSLLVAVLQAIRAILRSQRNGQLACIAYCLLGCVERMIRYFNKYAFAQCAIYGTSFIESAKATWSLFERQLLSALINDDLSGLPIFCGAILGFVVSGAAGYFTAMSFYSDNLELVLGLAYVSGIVGFYTVVCILLVVASGVVALFVCFAEDPAALAKNRPEAYQMLTGVNEDMRALGDRTMNGGTA